MVNPVEFALGIPGWMRELELSWLSRIAAALPSGAVWLEVGSWMGKSWSAVALSLPLPATIISVDTFDGGTYDGATVKYVKEHGPVMEDFVRVHEQVRKERPGLASLIMVMSSAAAAWLVADRSCDVVFIDGDHKTNAVLEDNRIWSPKIKSGGLLCGHDADDPNVLAALEDLPLERMDPSGRGSIWCRKRR